MLNLTDLHNTGIDLSHHNPELNFNNLTTDIWFCINKAFQTSKDSKFDSRTQQLIAYNNANPNSPIMYGAYCFLDGAIDPVSQANGFLAAVKPYPDCKLFVDFERNLPGQQSASVAQCEAFITYIQGGIKKLPVVYIGLYTLKFPSKVLSSCDLWLAKYGPVPKTLPLGFIWDQLKIWQHTDGHVGYNPAALILKDGSNYHCDRSMWKGTREELIQWWKR